MKQLTSTYEFTETHGQESVTIELKISHRDRGYSIVCYNGIPVCVLTTDKSARSAMNVYFAYAKAMEKAIAFAEKMLSEKAVTMVSNDDESPVNVPSVATGSETPRMKVKVLRVINANNEWLIGNNFEVIAEADIYYLLALPNGEDYRVLKANCEIVNKP